MATPVKRLGFKDKLKWTGITLIAFFILGEVALFGLQQGAGGDVFGELRTILASNFGTLITLGIGPIVMSSIIIQLLSGAGVLKFDMSTPNGKAEFLGAQKGLAIVFTVFEAAILVFGGQVVADTALIASRGLIMANSIIIFQIFLGGMLVILLDEIISKWGFGSGIGLFIAAGVTKEIVVRGFDWTRPGLGQPINGAVPAFISTLIQGSFTFIRQHPNDMLALTATIVVFIVTMYAQSVKVEVPISYGRVRGLSRRYPLPLVYSSVMPIIFISAIIGNLRFLIIMLNKAGIRFLGYFTGQEPHGAIYYVLPYSRFVKDLMFGAVGGRELLHAGVYFTVMVAGAVLFAKLWVGVSGKDSASLADQLVNSGMRIPGFRANTRVIQMILERYIPYLTVLGGAFVGALAAGASFTGALGGGTGVLLTVGIIYQLYQEIASEQMVEMHPALRGFIGDNSLS